MDTQNVQSTLSATANNPDLADVGAVLSGDSARFEHIMRRHNQRLFRLARSVLKNSGEAEDALQEAYISAFSKLHQFKGPAGFSGWLSRIVMNKSLARRRKHSVDRFVATEIETLSESPQTQPECQAAQDDVLLMIEAAIDRLPLEFRSVFMLRGVEELSVSETATHLGIKEATVKTRYHRARKLMRSDLAERVESTVLSAFSFDGERCDRIVYGVLNRVKKQRPGERK